VLKVLGKRPLGRLRRRWENNTKMDFKEKVAQIKVESTGKSCLMADCGTGDVKTPGSATTVVERWIFWR
jgi:hypothetical protein